MSTSEPAIATHTHNALLPALALAGKRQGMGPRLMPGWSIQQSIRTDRMRDGSQQNGTTIHGPRMRSPPLRGHGESAVPRATRRAALLPGCRVWRLNAGPQAGYWGAWARRATQEQRRERRRIGTDANSNQCQSSPRLPAAKLMTATRWRLSRGPDIVHFTTHLGFSV